MGIGVIDADGDGDVDFQEFLTGVGMMKKMMILSSQLDVAFRCYKEQSLAKSSFATSRNAPQSQSGRFSLGAKAKSAIRQIYGDTLLGSTGMPPSQMPSPLD